jgi:hypothetical protein
MNSESEKVKDFYYRVTGKELNHPSVLIVDFTGLFLMYRRYEKEMCDDMGNKKVIIKHRLN